MIRKQTVALIALLSIITVAMATIGCTSGGEPAPTATSQASASPSTTPTPLPAWYFTPKMAGWPFNVTDNASFSYTFTNNNVKPAYIRDDSYVYTTLKGNNTTLLHLVYRTQERKKNSEATQYDIYYEKSTGDVLNVTRSAGPLGAVTGHQELSGDHAASIDLRSNRSDWNSIREKAGTETVTVPAGTFNCTKYNVRFNATFVSSSIWMADFVPAPVKREMYNETGLAGAVYELTGYSLT